VSVLAFLGSNVEPCWSAVTTRGVLPFLFLPDGKNTFQNLSLSTGSQFLLPYFVIITFLQDFSPSALTLDIRTGRRMSFVKIPLISFKDSSKSNILCFSSCSHVGKFFKTMCKMHIRKINCLN